METVNKAVQPKPTKNEIIAAMAAIRYQELQEERKRIEAEREKKGIELRGKLEKFVQRNMKSMTPRINLGSLSGDRLYYVEAEYKLDNLPPELDKELRAYHKLTKPPIPDMAEVKKEIREALGDLVGMEARVQALVNNPATKKALSSMLEELGFSDNLKALAV